jgi:hypothetical protein
MLTRGLFFLACLFSLTVSAQETKKVSLFENKVELTIPVSFPEMSKEDIQKRFNRGTPPDFVFADKKGSPSISVSLKNNKITQETVEQYVDLVENSITGPLPEAKTIKKGTRVVNKRKVGYLVIVTPAVNGDIYNYMFFTDSGNKLLICNFSCMNRSAAEWADTAELIASSLTIN